MFYIGFPILSLIYIITLLIAYFSKKRINLFENKVVSTLMIINAIGLILELLCYAVLAFLQIQDTPIGMIILKSYIYYMYVFDWVLTGYICMITSNKYDTENYDKKEYYKKTLILSSPIIILGFFVTFFTKLEYYNKFPKIYTYGTTTNFLVFITGLIAPFWIYRCIKVSRTKKTREYSIRIRTILLGIIFVGIIGALTQLVDRSILIITSAHTLMLVAMYFTIENPDMQMVEELSENKKLTEQNYEEKTKFIFKISQDLKKPLQDIIKTSNELLENKENIEEKIRTINTNAKQLYTYVNNALDVSKMDINNLKIVENTYNTKNFFEEIKLRIKAEIKNSNKNIEFRYDISENIPEYLQGDNTKLKQIILSVICDSIKYTEEGFIELNINTIIKYGICRLMIDISDSGKGMNLHKINTILNVSEKIDPTDQEKIDKLDITLPLAHKIIKSLNGSFIIKSEENKGTNFLIILDQQIKENKKNKSLEKYSKKILNEKKILIVSVDNDTVEKIQKYCGENDIINSLYGRDAVERLKTEEFEFILIDDELKNESGLEVLNKIKNITNKPKYILLNKNKEFMKKHYIEDGFTNCIIKEDLEKELKKINK